MCVSLYDLQGSEQTTESDGKTLLAGVHMQC